MRNLHERLKEEYKAELDKVKAEAPAAHQNIVRSLESLIFSNLTVEQLMTIIYWLMPPTERTYDIFKATDKLFYEL